MSTPFAALEARLATACFTHLANATADLGGGVTVAGMFSNAYAEAFDLVGGSAPAFKGPSAGLDGLTRGSTLSIGGVNYAVAVKQPNGRGETLLILGTV